MKNEKNDLSKEATAEFVLNYARLQALKDVLKKRIRAIDQQCLDLYKRFDEHLDNSIAKWELNGDELLKEAFEKQKGVK